MPLINARIVGALHAAPGFFIYFPAGRHMPLKLRAFIDFMREKREQQIRPIHA